jgi:hypothetical protein
MIPKIFMIARFFMITFVDGKNFYDKTIFYNTLFDNSKIFKIARFFNDNTIFYASKISGVPRFFMTTHFLMNGNFLKIAHSKKTYMFSTTAEITSDLIPIYVICFVFTEGTGRPEIRCKQLLNDQEKRRYWQTERGSTRSHSVENFWKTRWTCHKAT